MSFKKNIFGIFDKIKTKYNNISIGKIEKIFLSILVIFSILAGTFLGILIHSVNKQADIASLEYYQPSVPTKIYDINNNLISELFYEKRELISYDDLPQDLINAIIAIEDEKFFSHIGIDFYGIGRAVVVNVSTMSSSQGASTLTQQLARTIFLNRQKTYWRKIQEIWSALQIEKKYSKKEILTLYFNQIFFGHAAYGIQAASKFYFDKDVNDLTLGEASMMAALPKSANRYSPIRNPDLAKQRHKLVLNRMVQLGFITKEEMLESYNTFWVEYQNKIKNRGTTAYADTINHAPYFTEHIRRILVQKYDKDKIYKEGLKVYTTIDLKNQKIAQEVMSASLKKNTEYFNRTTTYINNALDSEIVGTVDLLTTLWNVPINIGEYKTSGKFNRKLDSGLLTSVHQISLLLGINNVSSVTHEAILEKEDVIGRQVEGALISVNPHNGYIIAMVGGSGFRPQNQLNRATQARRQAGSVFKPFLYAHALESREYTAASVIFDTPVGYTSDDGTLWVPRNYSSEHLGPIRLREALRRSVNVISVKLLDSLGITNTINFTKAIFNTDSQRKEERLFHKDLTLALGTGEFSPLELTTGFAVLANGGKQVYPLSIRYVTDRDDVIIDNFEKELNDKILKSGGRKQVLNRSTAYIITDMLRGVMQPGGTAHNAMWNARFDRSAAGKTGTSSDWKDAWFAGYTPNMVTTIWIGFDNYKYSLGKGQAGGTISAPVWAEYSKRALAGTKRRYFSRPNNVALRRVCSESGLLPSDKCRRLIDEYFIYETDPVNICDIHDNEDSAEEDAEDLLEDLFNRKSNTRKKPLDFSY